MDPNAAAHVAINGEPNGGSRRKRRRAKNGDATHGGLGDFVAKQAAANVARSAGLGGLAPQRTFYDPTKQCEESRNMPLIMGPLFGGLGGFIGGKSLGARVGFATGGPVGAVIGAGLGFMLGRWISKLPCPPPRQPMTMAARPPTPVQTAPATITPAAPTETE